MRTYLTLVVLSGAALALTACGEKAATPATQTEEAAQGGAGAGLQMRPGLWELVANDGQAATQTVRVCIAEQTEPPLLAGLANCESTPLEREADGAWISSAQCDMGSGGRVLVAQRVTSDSDLAFTTVQEMTVSGAELPQMNRTATVTTTAKWLVDDCGDLKPGAMENALGVIDPSGMKPAN